MPGATLPQKQFFDTITVEVGVGQAGILAAARAEGLNFRKVGPRSCRHQPG